MEASRLSMRGNFSCGADSRCCVAINVSTCRYILSGRCQLENSLGIKFNTLHISVYSLAFQAIGLINLASSSVRFSYSSSYVILLIYN